MKACATPFCGHPKNQHRHWGNKHPGSCLAQGCPCPRYTEQKP